MNFIFDDTIQIDTNRLLLRKFYESDIKHMLNNWISDPDVQNEYGHGILFSGIKYHGIIKK